MLKARVVTALILFSVLLVILFLLPAAVAAVVFASIAALAAWEWAGLMRIDGAGRVMFAGLLLLLCWQIHVVGSFAFFLFCGASAVFWLLPGPLWLRFRWTLVGNDFLGYALGLLLLGATWTAMVALHVRSPWLLVGVLSIAWVSDIAAYFAGRAFGRRKLAPAISPGKTWEGVAGAVVGVLVYATVVATAGGWMAQATAATLLLGSVLLLLLTALGVVGDLFESLMKRQAGIKDSSNLLPGHGGILDRIDSQIAILPLAALVMEWGGK
ncbi:MAG: phosphatidate cytidylyltransferase [Rhodocyclales bacterium]|nr:phosphatidate cytidylyltransferase [Rhodocyclales bacterium]